MSLQPGEPGMDNAYCVFARSEISDWATKLRTLGKNGGIAKNPT